MSCIYWHGAGATAAVRGSERAWAGTLAGDLLVSALGVDDYTLPTDPIANLLPGEHYLRKVGERRFGVALRTWLRVGHDELVVDGEAVDLFAVACNTGLHLGNAAVRLLMRLHLQCEIHAYVEDEHRPWLADLIERGRKQGVLRANMDWEDVVYLLRTAAPGPIVTSYSGCEQFPNPDLVGAGEEWYELSGQEQWDGGIAVLRQRPWLLMRPEDWDDMHCGDWDGFTLGTWARAKERENE